VWLADDDVVPGLRFLEALLHVAGESVWCCGVSFPSWRKAYRLCLEWRTSCEPDAICDVSMNIVVLLAIDM